MKSRYIYLAATIAFGVGAIMELRPPRNVYAAVLDIIAGVIFLLLGLFPAKARTKPT